MAYLYLEGRYALLAILLLVVLPSVAAFGEPSDFIFSILFANNHFENFDSPRGVTTNSDDRIIVSDSNNNRIQVFDSSGNFVMSITDADGIGGTFDLPQGITTDSADRIIVSDTRNNRIQVFDSSGNFVMSITDADGIGDTFNQPIGVTSDSADRIIVSDTLNNRIQVFDSSGNFVMSITDADGIGDTFNQPIGVTSDSADRIIVSDTLNNRIQVFDSSGNFVMSITDADGIGGSFNIPSGVATDSDNLIFVSDTRNNRIQVFDSSGNFVMSITDADGIGGSFDLPIDVGTDSNGRILVSDTRNNRIQIFEGPLSSLFASKSDEDGFKDSNGGCSDCTPPTFGKDKAGVQIVSGGFAFNNLVPVDVTDFHTDFPLITVVTNQVNSATVKVYENQGVNNIAMVQFGLGMPEVGSPLEDAQALVEISLAQGDIDKIELIDSDNLVDITDISYRLVECIPGNFYECLELSMQYVYRDQPKYNVMAINAIDTSRNSKTNYMNDGILVIGESANKPLVQEVSVYQTGKNYPQRAGTVTLTLVDYKTDLWQDEYGYMWSTNKYGPYLIDYVSKPTQNPDPYSAWSGYNDRMHSEFETYKSQQTDSILQKLPQLYFSNNHLK